jgi:hypothetical protein
MRGVYRPPQVSTAHGFMEQGCDCGLRPAQNAAETATFVFVTHCAETVCVIPEPHVTEHGPSMYEYVTPAAESRDAVEGSKGWDSSVVDAGHIAHGRERAPSCVRSTLPHWESGTSPPGLAMHTTRRLTTPCPHVTEQAPQSVSCTL